MEQNRPDRGDLTKKHVNKSGCVRIVFLAALALLPAGLAGCASISPQPPPTAAISPSLTPLQPETRTAGPAAIVPSDPPPTAAPTDAAPKAAAAAAATTAAAAATSPTPPPLPIRALRLDFDDYTKSRTQISDLETKARAAGVNFIALGAGRVDWAYFKWSGHEAQWSGDVRDSGIDFLAEDAARFSQWARVAAVVDVYAPRYLQAHPEKAALTWLGKPSPYLVNTVELVDGDYGRLLLGMIEDIAARYPVSAISLTELVYYTEGYSDADKVSYMAYSGRNDWPRLIDGLINIDDASIGEWRSHEIGLFLKKARAAAQKYGKELYIDVSVSWDAPDNLGLEKGNHYPVMLENANAIVIWDYFAINRRSPEDTRKIIQALGALDRNRVILSIGLWDANNQPIPPQDLAAALDIALQGGIKNLWITPSQMLSDAHWRAMQTYYTK